MDSKLEKEMIESIYQKAVGLSKIKLNNNESKEIIMNQDKDIKGGVPNKPEEKDNLKDVLGREPDANNDITFLLLNVALDKQAELEKSNAKLLDELKKANDKNIELKKRLSSSVSFKSLCDKYKDKLDDLKDHYRPDSQEVKDELTQELPYVSEDKNTKVITASGLVLLGLGTALLIRHFKK